MCSFVCLEKHVALRDEHLCLLPILILELRFLIKTVAGQHGSDPTLLPALGLQSCAKLLDFIWVLGIHTRVFMLTQQVVCPEAISSGPMGDTF